MSHIRVLAESQGTPSEGAGAMCILPNIGVLASIIERLEHIHVARRHYIEFEDRNRTRTGRSYLVHLSNSIASRTTTVNIQNILRYTTGHIAEHILRPRETSYKSRWKLGAPSCSLHCLPLHINSKIPEKRATEVRAMTDQATPYVVLAANGTCALEISSRNIGEVRREGRSDSPYRSQE